MLKLIKKVKVNTSKEKVTIESNVSEKIHRRHDGAWDAVLEKSRPLKIIYYERAMDYS